LKAQTETDLLNKFKIHQQQAESGFVDLLLGFVMVIIALGAKMHNPGVVIALAGALVILSKGVWLRHILPRIPLEVSIESKPEKQPNHNYLILALIVVILIGFAMMNVFPKSFGTGHPLFNVMGVLISGMIILGGISRDQRFYLYAILLAIPLIVLQFQYGFWLGMSLMIATVLIFLVIIIYRIYHKTTESNMRVISRLGRVAHGFLAEVGLVLFAYFLLATYAPAFANWLKLNVVEHNTIVAGIGFAVLVTGVGISYLTFRFFVYSGLITIAVVSTKTMLAGKMTIAAMFIIIGFLILAIGILSLQRFTKKYPLLNEQK
jgi:hypothetical protein